MSDIVQRYFPEGFIARSEVSHSLEDQYHPLTSSPTISRDIKYRIECHHPKSILLVKWFVEGVRLQDIKLQCSSRFSCKDLEMIGQARCFMGDRTESESILKHKLHRAMSYRVSLVHAIDQTKQILYWPHPTRENIHISSIFCVGQIAFQGVLFKGRRAPDLSIECKIRCIHVTGCVGSNTQADFDKQIPSNVEFSKVDTTSFAQFKKSISLDKYIYTQRLSLLERERILTSIPWQSHSTGYINPATQAISRYPNGFLISSQHPHLFGLPGSNNGKDLPVDPFILPYVGSAYHVGPVNLPNSAVTGNSYHQFYSTNSFVSLAEDNPAKRNQPINSRKVPTLNSPMIRHNMVPTAESSTPPLVSPQNHKMPTFMDSTSNNQVKSNEVSTSPNTDFTFSSLLDSPVLTSDSPTQIYPLQNTATQKLDENLPSTESNSDNLEFLVDFDSYFRASTPFPEGS